MIYILVNNIFQEKKFIQTYRYNGITKKSKK